MFGPDTLAAKLLAALFACALSFAAGFGLEWHWRNIDEAADDDARAQAAVAVIKHQTAVAQQEGAAGQALADQAAGAFAAVQPQIRTITRTLTKEIPVYIQPAPQTQGAPDHAPVSSAQPVIVYGVPCGLLRLHDGAATGNDHPAGLPVCAGKPDGAPADVDLSQFAAVLVQNYGAFEDNREQLIGLQDWARQVALWYADLQKSWARRDARTAPAGAGAQALQLPGLGGQPLAAQGRLHRAAPVASGAVETAFRVERRTPLLVGLCPHPSAPRLRGHPRQPVLPRPCGAGTWLTKPTAPMTRPMRSGPRRSANKVAQSATRRMCRPFAIANAVASTFPKRAAAPFPAPAAAPNANRALNGRVSSGGSRERQ